jgi:site-specific recombinase XerD
MTTTSTFGVTVNKESRRTAVTNALEHGARMEQFQQLAGHSDIRTTEMYYAANERDAEDAGRHVQIR